MGGRRWERGAFTGGAGPDAERMQSPAIQGSQGMVDHPVTLEGRTSGELVRHDLEMQVAETVWTPGVSEMQGTVVPEHDPASGKGLGEV